MMETFCFFYILARYLMPDTFLEIVCFFSMVSYEITILFNSVNKWKIEFCNSKIIENLYAIKNQKKFYTCITTA